MYSICLNQMKMLQCTCRSGAQICSVTCVDLNHGNITVSDTFCNSAIRSEEEESSGINQCNTGWRTGPWSMVYTFYYNSLKIFYCTVFQPMSRWKSGTSGGMCPEWDDCPRW